MVDLLLRKGLCTPDCGAPLRKRQASPWGMGNKPRWTNEASLGTSGLCLGVTGCVPQPVCAGGLGGVTNRIYVCECRGDEWRAWQHVCLGRGAAPRWGLGAPGGGCLISEVPSLPPFLLAPSLVWASAGLPGRPVHASELWHKFHSTPGARREAAPGLPPP